MTEKASHASARVWELKQKANAKQKSARVNVVLVSHGQVPKQNRLDNGMSDPLEVAKCRPQFAFTWRGVLYSWNQLPQGWKHSPTICLGLIQAALEKGEAPEQLQYVDDIIIWGKMAEELFEKGEIIQILLKAGFAIKQGKVPSTHRTISATLSKWIALIIECTGIEKYNQPGILVITTNWPEDENFCLADEGEEKQGQTENGMQLYGAFHDELQKPLKEKPEDEDVTVMEDCNKGQLKLFGEKGFYFRKAKDSGSIQ
ncbi:hypothetical protein BTVI_12637 [Pitangus sulphuratus]|nr:hypothetical protein BTVI_12637 [Pitangus sulphuratus]